MVWPPMSARHGHFWPLDRTSIPTTSPTSASRWARQSRFWLALESPPAALVLRSPFTSLTDVGRLHYPWLPVRALLADRYPSISRSARVTVPLLVIAGDRDILVPAELSRRLYESACEPKRFVLVPGADHNSPQLLDGPRMLDAVVGFFAEHGVLAG